MIGNIALIGKKAGTIGMYDSSNKYVMLTLIKVDRNVVLDVKTQEKNGYNAVVLAGNDIKKKSLSKPQHSMFAKANIEQCKKTVKEFRLDFEPKVDLGFEFSLSDDMIGELVDIRSKTVGKGFQGPMKRHGFSGLRASHGVSVSHRSHGSTGHITSQGKVYKGKKMAGRMGGVYKTCQSLEIVSVDKENGIIGVLGSVAGHENTDVVIKSAVKVYRPATTKYNGIDLSIESRSDKTA